MKNRALAIVVIILLVVLSRTALQLPSCRQVPLKKKLTSLGSGYRPVAGLSQESGEYRSLGNSALWAGICGRESE